MADNLSRVNEDVFVVQSYDNILLVDPNKVIGQDGQVRERGIKQEDFVMYANLEAQMLPRTKLIEGQAQDDGIQTQVLASINFLRPGGKTFLDNTYTDQFTGLNSLIGEGINQPSIQQISKPNKSSEFYYAQNTINKQDTGLLGIESIAIKNTRSFTPTVDMVLIDTHGRALFEKGENSEYAFFFNLPYPTFYLTIKGYYGKAIKYQLILTKFSAAFESATGNYRITLQFYSYKYTVLAETQIGALFATPFMYASDFKITTEQSPSISAAQVSVGDDKKTAINVRTTRGRQFISNVYKKYKALGLLDPDFPEVTFPEFRAQLQSLQKNLETTFGQSDFTPLTNADEYFEILQTFRTAITDPTTESSWFRKYIDTDKIFILKQKDNNTGTQDNNQPTTQINKNFKTQVWILNQQTRSNSQFVENALTELQQIVTKYKTALLKNPTFGVGGTFTVDKVIRTSQIKTIEQIDASKSKDRALVQENSFVKLLNANDIDWIATYEARYKRKPLNEFEWTTLRNEETQLFQTILDEVLKDAKFPNYTFVFSNGVGQFEEIIDKTFGELETQKKAVIEYLSIFLNKKIEGPNGLGFKPTMRNVMGIIFASVEAFYRLLDLVHKNAWVERNNPIKKFACYESSDGVSPDIKNNNKDVNQNSLINQEVYPWPLYLTKQIEKDGKQNYVVMYPGEQSEIQKTRASNYQIWPEVQFVEEYIRGITKSYQSESQQSGNLSENDIGRIINRITVNAVEFPTSNAILSDLQDVKFLYEIYERVLLQTFWDRLSRPNAEKVGIIDSLSEMELINIRNALNSFSNPFITKLLKNTAFSSANYLQVLRNISNEGVGISWQQFIRGVFTSDYLRAKTQKDFSILPAATISSGANNSSKDTSILKNVQEFIKSSSSNTTDLLDLYPFVDNSWVQQNLSNVNNNSSYNSTTRSLFLNDTLNYITNFQTIANANNNINRPFVNNSYLSFTEPNIVISNFPQQIGSNNFVDFNTYYTEKINSSKFAITEGPLSYSGNTGNLQPNQTVSMLNTPYFTNAFIEGVQNDRNDIQYPYLKAAYLFLNSLPLSTLREPLKDIVDVTSNVNNVSKDYLFATLTKFGAIHRLPYAWVLKYGSIWHRYKKYVESGIDILDSVWKNVDVGQIYYPTTNSLQHQYVTKNLYGSGITIYAQTEILNPFSIESIQKKYVGFYPSLVNDVLFFYTGLDFLTGYTNNDLDNFVDEGLNIGATDATMREGIGFDPNFTNRNASLDFQGWFMTFNTKTSAKFNTTARNKTIVLPSFGTNYNQVKYECFKNNGTRLIMSQPILNNTAVNDGSIRFFWGAPNFGYFDNSSITKPAYNEYVNLIQPSKDNSNAFEMSNKYSNIEEIFGVFKTEILDEFETEFLNFSRSGRQFNSQELLSDDFVNRSFQQVFANCLVVDEVSKELTQTNYVNTCVTKQGRVLTEAIQKFLNYNIAFKFGNPGNFDRKLFGSVTTDDRYRVFDGYDFSPYVLGSLPGDSLQTSLLDSQFRYPEAWKTLRTYVGFATVDGMKYSDSGSCITDFFITMNVGFTPENIQIVAPLVKIFATQKLGEPFNNYTRSDFVTEINDFYTTKNNFLNLVLNSLFNLLQKQLPQLEESTDKPLLSAINGVQPKIELYQAFKSFNDKWIAGANFEEKTIFEEVLFLDRANRDVGDVLVDPFKLLEFFNSYASLDARVIDFVSKILVDNKFFMMPMPAYINWWGQGEVRNGIEPKSQTVEDIANNLFGIYNNVDTRDSKPAFLCYYVGNPSEHLELNQNSNYGWRSDGFDFANQSQNSLAATNTKQNWANTNRVVGFNVDFGTRNQSIFSSINMDQILGASTTEANKVITEMAAQAGGLRTSLGSVSLYNLYKTRSYNVRVEALGCALIQPTMYFNLRYVPMFNGAYQIQSVEHRIEAGSFKTYFEGIRMPFYSLAKIDTQLLSINNNLLSELVQQVRRLKQSSAPTSGTTNNISIVNSIQTNLRYTTVQPIFCDASIRSSELPYKNWEGTEGFVSGITYANFSNILKQKTTDPRVRAMVFYTAYNNGHDDNQFITFNYDLGGTPLGGYPIPNINYGGLNSYMSDVYTCKQFPNGGRVPYATFASFEKSIEFIKNLYFTTNSNNLLIPDAKIGYNNKWVTQADYRANMFILWTYYWPRKRFQTPEDFEKWRTNTSQTETFVKAGDEVYQKLKQFKLI